MKNLLFISLIFVPFIAKADSVIKPKQITSVNIIHKNANDNVEIFDNVFQKDNGVTYQNDSNSYNWAVRSGTTTIKGTTDENPKSELNENKVKIISTLNNYNFFNAYGARFNKTMGSAQSKQKFNLFGPEITKSDEFKKVEKD